MITDSSLRQNVKSQSNQDKGEVAIAPSHETHLAIALPQQLRSPYWGYNTAIVPTTKNSCEAEGEILVNCDFQNKL
jgi:hypothetical protein